MDPAQDAYAFWHCQLCGTQCGLLDVPKLCRSSACPECRSAAQEYAADMASMTTRYPKYQKV